MTLSNKRKEFCKCSIYLSDGKGRCYFCKSPMDQIKIYEKEEMKIIDEMMPSFKLCFLAICKIFGLSLIIVSGLGDLSLIMQLVLFMIGFLIIDLTPSYFKFLFRFYKDNHPTRGGWK